VSRRVSIQPQVAQERLRVRRHAPPALTVAAICFSRPTPAS
jgi:hypothetical protein